MISSCCHNVGPAMSGLHAGPELLLMGCPNRSVDAIIASVDFNYDSHLKPFTFWTHFFSVVTSVLDCIATYQPPTPHGDAVPVLVPTDATVADSGADGEVADSNGAVELTAADAVSVRSTSNSPDESFGSSGENVVATATTGGASAASSPGPMPPVPGSSLNRAVVLTLAGFWIKLATWLSVALDSSDPSPTDEVTWRPSAASFPSDHALLKHVLVHIHQVLVSDEPGLLDDILGLPQFEVMVRDMLFHAHDAGAREQCKKLLRDCVPPGRPSACLRTLDVCLPSTLLVRRVRVLWQSSNSQL
jgi:hypothetical protein